MIFKYMLMVIELLYLTVAEPNYFDKYIVYGNGTLLDTDFPTISELYSTMDQIRDSNNNTVHELLLGYTEKCNPLKLYCISLKKKKESSSIIQTDLIYRQLSILLNILHEDARILIACLNQEQDIAIYTLIKYIHDNIVPNANDTIHRLFSAKSLKNASNIISQHNKNFNNSDITTYIKKINNELKTIDTINTTFKKPTKNIKIFFINALHHAREPISSLATINFFNDALNKRLLSKLEYENEIQLHIMPVVNPDGLLAIQKTGYKMIRKNARNTCKQNSIANGVDLNRNYEIGFEKLNNFCDLETYAGPYPFSEPETRAIKRYILQFKPNIALNVHAYGFTWVIPFNCCKNRELHANHEKIYKNIQKQLKLESLQNSINTKKLNYTAKGEATDWMYANAGVIAMTVELGNENDGFYPDKSKWPSIYQYFNEKSYALISYINDSM